MKNLVVRYLEEDEYNKWDEFVETSPQGNIFNKSYWLKAVCDNFKILVGELNGKIVGGIALPNNFGKLYRNPKLTPQLGVLLFNKTNKDKYSTVLSKEIEITEALIEKLPPFKQFDYNFSYNYTNFLPFIWKDFKFDLHYTYVIEDLSDTEKLYSGFQYDVKYVIKKAVKNNLKVREDGSIKEFYEVNKKTFDRQKMEMSYTLEFITELDNVLKEHGNRKILLALDSEDRIIAGVYLLYDKNCTYYLMGGADPEYRKLGAQTLLLWESIKFAATVSEKFDFEGSTVKGIESSFREFGGTQKLIHSVHKSDKFTEFAYGFARKHKNLIRKIIKV